VRIVDEGLKASLDTRGGGPLAVRLQELYGFITMRLLQGNLRNDPHKLEEAAKLLGELRAAWSQIKPAPAAAARAEAAARVALAV
jgi:flagellar protein FliS